MYILQQPDLNEKYMCHLSIIFDLVVIINIKYVSHNMIQKLLYNSFIPKICDQWNCGPQESWELSSFKAMHEDSAHFIKAMLTFLCWKVV